MNNLPLKQEVMMRVRFIHLIKRTLRPFAIEIVVGAAALLEVGRTVFVAKVFENAPSLGNVSESAAFFTHAFTHTHPLVQLSIAVVSVALVLAIKDIVKTVRGLSALRLSRV